MTHINIQIRTSTMSLFLILLGVLTISTMARSGASTHEYGHTSAQQENVIARPPFQPGHALASFEKMHAFTIHRFLDEGKTISMHDNPRVILQIVIAQGMKERRLLNNDDFKSVYSALFSIAQDQNANYAQHHYPDVVQVLKETYKDFDPTFSKPTTQRGYFPYHLSKKQRPLTQR